MKNKPLDKKQALCLRGGLIYYWGGNIQSAVDGLYDEFTKSILETSELDPINIVRHFGDLQKKWFPDIRTKLVTKVKER